MRYLRAKSMFALVAMIAACAPAKGTDQATDPCASVIETGDAILRQSGIADRDKGSALAHHVIAHEQCYKPETVAHSRIILAQADQPLPTPSWAVRDWYNPNP